jgi:HK97 family phage major capsid protein/HK97 family phage prohead protease
MEPKPVRLDIPVCRETQSENVEIRAAENGGKPVMRGHFSKFGNFYEINSSMEGHFLERVAPGAFRKTFQEQGDRIRVLLEHGHDPSVGDKPLGVPRHLGEDAEGAAYEVELFDTSYTRDLIPALEAGVYGSSFKFRAVKDEWDDAPERSDANPEGIPERTITEMRVFEFGPTLFPANPSATAGLRSTTDEYYDRLRSKDPEEYEVVMRSVRNQMGLTVEETEDAEENNATQGYPAPTKKKPKKKVDPDTESDEDEEEDDEEEDEDEEGKPKKKAAPKKKPLQKNSIPDTEAAESTSDVAEGAGPSTPVSEPRKHSNSNPNTSRKKIVMEHETMTVEERHARVSEIRSRLSEIDSEFNGAALDGDTQTEWDSLNEEYDSHERAIAAAEERRSRLAAIAEDNPRNVERGTNFGSPAFHTKSRDIYDIASLRRDARNMDELSTMYRENALRAVEQHRFPGVADRAKAQEQVEHLLHNVDDESGTLARRILTTGSPTYDRAFGKAVKSLNTMNLTNEERTALASGAGAQGGFAVPFQLDPTVILTSDGSVNPYRQIARKVQITTTTWQAVTSAGVTVARAAEATEASDNAPVLAQPEVTPQRVQGFIPFSMEIEADWGAMRSELTMLLNDAKEQEENTAFTDGDGTGVNAGGIPATLTASQDVSAGATFEVADLYALENALPNRWRPRASFVANKSVYNLIRQFDTSGGSSLWVRLGAGRPGELIGYPAYENSAMDDFAASGGKEFLLLGDFNQFVIVDRVGMTVELVPHLFGSGNRFPTGQRGIYAIWRNTSEILVPGAFRVLKGAA